MVAPAFNLSVLKSHPMSIVGAGYSMLNKENLLTRQPGEKAVFQMEGNAGGGFYYSQVDFDLGSVVQTDQVALLYHDSASAANYFMLHFSNTADFSVLVESLQIGLTLEQEETRPLGYRHGMWSRIGQPIAARYMAVQLFSQTNTDISVGRIIAGKAVQPEFNSDYGDTSWGYEEPPEPELLDSGVEVLTEYTPAPVMEFRLSWLSELEMNRDWEPLSRLAHLGEPVLVARRPDPHAYRHNGLFYGRLRLTPITAADFDMYEVSGKIRSMI